MMRVTTYRKGVHAVAKEKKEVFFSSYKNSKDETKVRATMDVEYATRLVKGDKDTTKHLLEGLKALPELKKTK